MWDLKSCTVCLSIDVKLYSFSTDILLQDFNLASGLKRREGDGLPHYLCVECMATVKRFRKFRDKCNRAHYVLEEILKRNKEITLPCIKAVNRVLLNITPSLSFMDTSRTCYQELKFQWIKHNRPGTVTGEIPVIKFDTLTDRNDHNLPKRKIASHKEPVKLEDEPIENDSFDVKLVNEPSDNGDLNFFDDQFETENEVIDDEGTSFNKKEEQEADGSSLDEEYAKMIPIPKHEAQAVVELYNMFGATKFKCELCTKGYHTAKRLEIHMRMHDKHTSGHFFCDICQYYYKTEFLLQTHNTEKHMYKYLCKKCPEVTFNRISAKQHYILSHIQKDGSRQTNWNENRPSWLSSKGGKRVKGDTLRKSVRKIRKLSEDWLSTKSGKLIKRVAPVKSVKKKIRKLPEDFLVYKPIGHEEQYTLVQDRQKSRNYIGAEYKCELCYRGFREIRTFNKHMRKHDPLFSGPLQCDMCKIFVKDTRKMYKHMNTTHLFKYSCQLCPYICCNRGQANMHYRWHKNVTYKCPHCHLEFKKASTQLTHIRIKHPSTNICELCGHSFVSDAGLYFHKKLVHKNHVQKDEPQELETPIADDPLYCADCNIRFMSMEAFDTHLGSSNKHATINFSTKPNRSRKYNEKNSDGVEIVRRRGRPRTSNRSEILNTGVITATHCELCGKFLSNDVQARKHYQSEHPGHDFLKRYMCDVCGHTTKQYANLLVHMRTHTREKPYECPHCERRFSMPSNRDRHLVVHTGEKRYQCQHCNRRFTQSSAVKLHIQTVHLKIPYAPWDKANRKRRAKIEAIQNTTEPQPVPFVHQPQPKFVIEPQGDYLNAYITYNDE